MPVHLYQSVQHHIPEDSILYGCYYENKSHSNGTDFPTCIFQTHVSMDCQSYSHPVENSVWKSLWTCHVTDYGMSECSCGIRSLWIFRYYSC